MAKNLQSEIRQNKPFVSPHEEAHLSVIRTASMFSDGIEDVLKPHGITGTQYNVLRILRGAGPDGLCRNELRDRMLTRMPDMTRLLDRMEATGLVRRTREAADRRLVSTRITAQGSALVDSLDDTINEVHDRTLGHMTTDDLKTLIALLSLARDGSPVACKLEDDEG